MFYGIAGPLVNTGDANAQLVIPNPSASIPQPVLEFTGPGTAIVNLWTYENPQVYGALVSFGLFASTGDYETAYENYGPSAVLGSTPSYPELLPNVDDLPAFANICAKISGGLTIVTPSSSAALGYTPLNLGGCAKAVVDGFAGLITTNYQVESGANQFPATGSLIAPKRGLILPCNSNNDLAIARDTVISGCAFPFQLGEHAYLENPVIVGNWFAFELSGNDGASSQHLVKIVNASVESCTYGFYLNGDGAGYVGFFVDAEIDVEGIDENGLIQDSNSGGGLASLFGEIRVYGNYDINIFPPGYPTSVKLISKSPAYEGTVPGLISGYTGFSGAGSGVAVQNPYWRDVEVIFSGGDITAVNAGVTLGGSGGEPGTAPSMDATGLSGSGSVLWPAGGWLSFTYSGSPTWNVQVPT